MEIFDMPLGGTLVICRPDEGPGPRLITFAQELHKEVRDLLDSKNEHTEGDFRELRLVMRRIDGALQNQSTGGENAKDDNARMV